MNFLNKIFNGGENNIRHNADGTTGGPMRSLDVKIEDEPIIAPEQITEVQQSAKASVTEEVKSDDVENILPVDGGEVIAIEKEEAAIEHSYELKRSQLKSELAAFRESFDDITLSAIPEDNERAFIQGEIKKFFNSILKEGTLIAKSEEKKDVWQAIVDRVFQEIGPDEQLRNSLNVFLVSVMSGIDRAPVVESTLEIIKDDLGSEKIADVPIIEKGEKSVEEDKSTYTVIDAPVEVKVAAPSIISKAVREKMINKRGENSAERVFEWIEKAQINRVTRARRGEKMIPILKIEEITLDNMSQEEKDRVKQRVVEINLEINKATKEFEKEERLKKERTAKKAQVKNVTKIEVKEELPVEVVTLPVAEIENVEKPKVTVQSKAEVLKLQEEKEDSNAVASEVLSVLEKESEKDAWVTELEKATENIQQLALEEKISPELENVEKPKVTVQSKAEVLKLQEEKEDSNAVASEVLSVLEKESEKDAWVTELEKATENIQQLELEEKISPELENRIEKEIEKESWVVEIESAIEKIKEMALNEAREKYCDEQVVEGFAGNYADYLQNFLHMHEHGSVDSFTQKEKDLLVTAIGNAMIINEEKSNLELIVVNGNTWKMLKTPSVQKSVEEEESEFEKSDTIKLENVLEENAEQREVLEDDLIHAIHIIEEVEGDNFKIDSAEKQSSENVKDKMEELLNRSGLIVESADTGKAERYQKELEQLHVFAQKINDSEKEGKTCVVYNNETFIVKEEKAESIQELEKIAKSFIGKKYLSAFVFSIGRDYESYVGELEQVSRWHGLSIEKQKELKELGVVALVDQLLDYNGMAATKDVKDKIYKYFNTILNKK